MKRTITATLVLLNAVAAGIVVSQVCKTIATAPPKKHSAATIAEWDKWRIAHPAWKPKPTETLWAAPILCLEDVPWLDAGTDQLIDLDEAEPIPDLMLGEVVFPPQEVPDKPEPKPEPNDNFHGGYIFGFVGGNPPESSTPTATTFGAPPAPTPIPEPPTILLILTGAWLCLWQRTRKEAR